MNAQNRLRLLSAAGNVLWIFALICGIALLFPGVPSWPVFFLGIFLTVYEGKRSLWQLLLHAAMGLLVAWLYVLAAGWLFARFANAAAKLLPLLPALAVILFGCLYAPRLFGMVSFGYFTAALIESTSLGRPLVLFVALLIGAPLQIGGSQLMEKALEKYLLKGETNGKQK